MIAAEGDNGVEGYVRKSELNLIAEPMGIEPSTPEEALRLQEMQDELIENNEYIPKVINLYDKEGVNILDTFTNDASDNYQLRDAIE